MFAVQGRLHAANDGNLSFTHQQLKDAAKLHIVFSYITMLIVFCAFRAKYRKVQQPFKRLNVPCLRCGLINEEIMKMPG